MAFTYTVKGDLGRLRERVHDIVETGHIFEDELLEDALSQEGSVDRAASVIWGLIASNKDYLEHIFGPLKKEDIRSLAGQARSIAADYREQANLDEGHLILGEDELWEWDWEEYRDEYLS